MKELTIKEKAKRYDEAIERAKGMHKEGMMPERIEYIFPELKESEDEKIKKVLITIVTNTEPSLTMLYGVDKADLIAWLEKQGEQKPVEWSEEDEICLEEVKQNFRVNKDNMTPSLIEQYERFFTKIKSLRPQNMWKPSNEQMVALNNVILLNEDHYNGAVLSTLREQLLKLMEE